MAGTPAVQVQAETRGAVPEGAVGFAVHRVGSLLKVASEPVLFARVKLVMAADPAVECPAIAQVSAYLNGRLLRAPSGGRGAETPRTARHRRRRTWPRCGRASHAP